MNIHITRIHKAGGAGDAAQDGVATVAKTLGFKEIAIEKKVFHEDYWNAISHHIDGVIAPLFFDDVVFFQYPTFCGPDYDRQFVEKVKAYKGVKLIILVHDIQKLLFNSEHHILESEIEILNNADLLILPSQKMRKYLIKNGMREDLDVVYQKTFEVPKCQVFETHWFHRRMFFTGNADRFLFVMEYHGKTQIHHYAGVKSQRENDESYCYKGALSANELMKHLSEGGFGLVWSDDEEFERYYSMNHPHKECVYLASGIPVIVRSGCASADRIRENGLGLVVDTLKEADFLIQNISEEEYNHMISNVAIVQQMSSKGIYTKKMLIDALVRVMEQ